MNHREEHRKGFRRKGLLVLVSIVALGVWGGVIYRLTVGLHGSDEPIAHVAPPMPMAAEEEDASIPTYRKAPRDIFRAPASLRASPSVSEEKKREEPPERERPRRPTSTLRLAGVVDGMALLAAKEGNVRLVRKGETLHGHRVVHVGADFVLLEIDAHKDTLRLHPRRRGFTIR